MPIGKDPDRDLGVMTVAAAGITPSTAAGGLADWFEHPIDQCRADCQQLTSKLQIKLYVAVPFKRFDQAGQYRLETFAADPIGCLPEDDQ